MSPAERIPRRQTDPDPLTTECSSCVATNSIPTILADDAAAVLGSAFAECAQVWDRGVLRSIRGRDRWDLPNRVLVQLRGIVVISSAAASGVRPRIDGLTSRTFGRRIRATIAGRFAYARVRPSTNACCSQRLRPLEPLARAEFEVEMNLRLPQTLRWSGWSVGAEQSSDVLRDADDRRWFVNRRVESPRSSRRCRVLAQVERSLANSAGAPLSGSVELGYWHRSATAAFASALTGSRSRVVEEVTRSAGGRVGGLGASDGYVSSPSRSWCRTTMRRPNRRDGISPRRTHSYAVEREIPSNAATSATV